MNTVKCTYYSPLDRDGWECCVVGCGHAATKGFDVLGGAMCAHCYAQLVPPKPQPKPAPMSLKTLVAGLEALAEDRAQERATWEANPYAVALRAARRDGSLGGAQDGA